LTTIEQRVDKALEVASPDHGTDQAGW
jgi:hypothetical protein